MNRAIAAIRRGLSRLRPYEPMRGGHAVLDAEYREGNWDYLRALSELSRFSVIAGYCQQLKPGGSVLEIGCGEGLLTQRLDKAKYSRYLGVDISSVAISLAAARRDPATTFVAADAQEFVPPARFDLILFNECLEYFNDPAALLRKYEAHLEPGGLYIASIFDGIDTARSVKIWRMLGAHYDDLARTRLENEEGFSWSIKVLRPSARR